MGKMKELYTRYLEEHDNNDHLDDEYHCEKWLEKNGYKSPTMEEVQANHDAWWDSLTDKQKQKLFEEAEAAELERLEQQSNLEEYRRDYDNFKDSNDFEGLNGRYGV